MTHSQGKNNQLTIIGDDADVRLRRLGVKDSYYNHAQGYKITYIYKELEVGNINRKVENKKMKLIKFLELTNTISKIKYSKNEFNGRMEMTEERPEDLSIEI